MEQWGGNMTVSKRSASAKRKRADRLDIARRLYWALVAQNPDRQITLRDGRARVLARSKKRSDEDAAEKARHL